MDQYEDSAGSLARIARLNDDENRSKITGCNFNDDLGKAFESKNLPERLGAVLNAIMRESSLQDINRLLSSCTRGCQSRRSYIR